MAADIDIPYPNIHPRVGVQPLEVDPGLFPIGPDSWFEPRPYAVLLFWKRSVGPWFSAQAEADSHSAVTRFGNNVKDLVETITKHHADQSVLAQEVATDEWVREHHFLVGSVSALAAIRLRFRIDTNIEGFVKFVAEPPEGSHRIDLAAIYFAGSETQPDYQRIQLLLQPATLVQSAQTLVGLDIGNTNTTAALLNPLAGASFDSRPLTQRVPMLTSRVIPGLGGNIGVSDSRGAPIPSELRFDLFRSWLPAGSTSPTSRQFPNRADYPDDDLPNAVDYVVGDLARSPGAPVRSTVIGAKRMAAARPLPNAHSASLPQFAVQQISATHRIILDPPGSGRPEIPAAVINLDVRAPLELLACRIFQHFREDQKAWPAKIALTYPTTYSRYELQSLRRAVQRGWLRMQAARQVPGTDFSSNDRTLVDLVRQLQSVVSGRLDLDTQSRDPVVQLLVDEASAAAFFHLYRKIFEETDGGLATFRYLYEQGLNMLLYDCGGGTTDIALVRAVVESDVRTLRITVLRRSGVRTFGGDNITRQVCRLLKAKIAHQLATDRKRPVPAPPNIPAKPPLESEGWKKLAADLERFITEMTSADPQDELVPTRTLPGQPATEDRRAAALSLWRLGEQAKHRLALDKPPSGASPGFVIGEYRLPPMERDTSPLSRAIFTGETAQIASLKKKLEQISITRIEIDALIHDPVMQSISNCNKLINEFIEKPARDGMFQEVHWVVASGNAVRYPFIQQLLRRHLAVAFLDDEQRFTFDPDNAKDATAKGAVLALAAMEESGDQIDLRFDSDLSDHLPFNVGFRDMKLGAIRILFEEHSHYRDLKQRDPIIIPIADAGEKGVATRRFILLRQFPGDQNFHSFLAFEFPEGVQGRHITVAYDDTSEFEFRVIDEKGNEGTAIDLTAEDTYRAPAQRGDI